MALVFSAMHLWFLFVFVLFLFVCFLFFFVASAHSFFNTFFLIDGRVHDTSVSLPYVLFFNRGNNEGTNSSTTTKLCLMFAYVCFVLYEFMSRLDFVDSSDYVV